MLANVILHLFIINLPKNVSAPFLIQLLMQMANVLLAPTSLINMVLVD